MTPVGQQHRDRTAVALPTVRAGRMNRQDFLPCVEELRPAPKPEDCWLRLAGLPHVLFLDSALRHPTLGRYSFLTADPFDWLQARGPSTAVSSERQVREPANPFTVLAECLDRYRTEPLPGLPPFQGGVAGLWGYDLCHHLERLPRPLRDEFQVPDLAVGFYDWVLAFDHATDRTWLISTGFPELDPSRRERRARRRIREILERLRAAPPAIRHKTAERPIDLADQWPIAGCPGLLSTFSRESYVAALGRVLAYIHAGDCFQVNLAQRLLYPADEPSVELYVRLRACNPAPFAGYFDLGEFTLASASPERFLRVEQGEVETRPIKGTRPRGATPAEDQERIEELQQSAKDRAENIMIVDLLRNDLGRVCRYGSVRVPAVCRVESYPFVHHLVSEVRGRLWPGLGPVDLLRAAFPGGSVTGAPKIRAMEIIAELEPTVRGPYCGSLGYIGFDGAMDSNILIRTLTVGRGWIQFPVGGGIVADSVPLREYDETWHKAEGLLRAFR